MEEIVKRRLLNAGIVAAAVIIVIGIAAALFISQSQTDVHSETASPEAALDGEQVDGEHQADSGSSEAEGADETNPAGSDPAGEAGSALQDGVRGGIAEASSESGSGADGPGGAPSKSDRPSCLLSIDCKSVLGNMDGLAAGKAGCVPRNGVILGASRIAFDEGQSVFDALKDACARAGIALDCSSGPLGGSCYIKGINGLYEFDCGPESGWTFTVNGVMVNTSSSECRLKDNDVVAWSYVCKL